MNKLEMIRDINGVVQSVPLNNLITLAFALIALNLPILISILQVKEKGFIKHLVLLRLIKPRVFINSFLISLILVLILHTIKWGYFANVFMIVIIVAMVWYITYYSYHKYTKAQFDTNFFNKERNKLIKQNYEHFFLINKKREAFLNNYGVDYINIRYLEQIEAPKIYSEMNDLIKINYTKIGEILSQYNKDNESEWKVSYIALEGSMISQTLIYLSSTVKVDKLTEDVIKELQQCFSIKYRQDKKSQGYLLDDILTDCEKGITNGLSTEFNQTIEIVEKLADNVKDSSSLEGIVLYYTGVANIIQEVRSANKLKDNLLARLYYSFLYTILPITSRVSQESIHRGAFTLSQVFFSAYLNSINQNLLDYGSDLLLALIKYDHISRSDEIWNSVDSHIINFVNKGKIEGARYLLEKFFSPINSEEGAVEEILLQGCERDRAQYTKSQKLYLFIILAILNDSSKKGLELILGFYNQLEAEDPEIKDLYKHDTGVSSILRNHIHPIKATHKFGGASTAGGTVNYQALYDNTIEVIKELRKS
jgi:hypothetical protein